MRLLCNASRFVPEKIVRGYADLIGKKAKQMRPTTSLRTLIFFIKWSQDKRWWDSIFIVFLFCHWRWVFEQRDKKNARFLICHLSLCSVQLIAGFYNDWSCCAESIYLKRRKKRILSETINIIISFFDEAFRTWIPTGKPPLTFCFVSFLFLFWSKSKTEIVLQLDFISKRWA